MNTVELSEEMARGTERKRVRYTGRVHTTGGRDGGASRSSDGRLELRFSQPGSIGPGTNPEQLLAAGWSSCFLTAMKLEAHKLNVWLPSNAAINAEVDLCRTGELHSLQARLHISVPGLEREIAQALVDLAHQRCPLSKATHGNIEVAIRLI
jgi:lipoyl-dependent peroxiredoxin